MPTENDVAELMLRMLKDRDSVIRGLAESMDVCVKTQKGCQNVLDNWHLIDQGDNLKNQLQTAIKTNQRLATVSCQLILVMLVYTMSDGFISDSGKVLTKMGRGREAIREIFKQKFGDKFAEKWV
ncbi:MAG: hypothetical protein DRP45_12065 [Candidatus Zixiibacteriota bacterium]|nr:MAG: hypothetical protein DRP45_12065 [candidate division Zixibacteria bacterium]